MPFWTTYTRASNARDIHTYAAKAVGKQEAILTTWKS